MEGIKGNVANLVGVSHKKVLSSINSLKKDLGLSPNDNEAQDWRKKMLE